MFMATLDGSIVIIALSAIFRGIHLDLLAAGNISYLLWMIMGYRHGLVVVFAFAAILAALAALASVLRGARPAPADRRPARSSARKTT